MRMVRAVRAAVRAHKQPDTYTTFGEILVEIGGFGRYQKMLFIVILYSTLVWLSATIFDDFGRIQPVYRCLSAPENTSVCENRHNCTNMTVESSFKSVVQEFELNCEQTCNEIREIDITMDLSGAFGSIIGGHIGDNWGRKSWLFGAQVLLCISSVMTVAATRWEAFMTMQIINSFLEQMAFVLSYTILMEITDRKHRLLANLCSRYFLAYTITAIIAYLTKEWRWYLIVCNFFTAPVLIIYLLVHESPRYLVQRGMYVHAAEVLNDISERWNRKEGVHFTPDRLKSVLRPSRTRFYTFVDLFRHPLFVRVGLMQMLAAFTLGLYLHALDSNIDFFSSVGPFRGFALLGSMQVFSPLFIIFLDRFIPRFGRKTMFNLSLFAMIICYGVVLARYEINHSDVFSNWATYGLSLIGYCTATSGFFFSIVLITVEFFPTYIRATALGTVLSMSKFASVILASHCHNEPHRFVPQPYIVGISASVFTLIIGYCFQVETKGVHLPDTLQQSVTSPLARDARKTSQAWKKASQKVLSNNRKKQSQEETGEPAVESFEQTVRSNRY